MSEKYSTNQLENDLKASYYACGAYISNPQIAQSYTYDNLYRLTGWVNGGITEGYTYDDIGNRLMMNETGTTTNFVFNPLQYPNRLMSHFNTLDQCDYEYFADGSLEKTKNKDLLNNIQRINHFEYDYRGLLTKYFNTTQYALSPGVYLPENIEQTRTEWRYWYNPFNEREQKRMYHSSNTDMHGGVYPWVYYQLGVDKKQYAVYHGCQIADAMYQSIGCGPQANPTTSVYFFPAEYNTYGSSSSPLLTFKFDENSSQWMKNIKIYDHIGNVRTVIKDGSSYELLSQYDYKPFGAILSQTGNSERQSFIGKEKDYESSLGDFGVRKYDDFTGRFFQIDPLWEKYYSHTPYHYSANNPVSFLDPGGEYLSYSLVEGGKDGLYGFKISKRIHALCNYSNKKIKEMVHFVSGTNKGDLRNKTIYFVIGDVPNEGNDGNPNGLGLASFYDGYETVINFEDYSVELVEKDNPTITIDLEDINRYASNKGVKTISEFNKLLEKILLEEIKHAYDTFKELDPIWMREMDMNESKRMQYEKETEEWINSVMQEEEEDD
jgi:RHS repeat-associated protein